MHPDIAAIMRGEADPLSLSDRERELLGFALDLCGEQLGSFLLTGLGEDTASRSRHFTVTFTGPAGTPYEREIKITANQRGGGATSSLPRRREPLVMLALLRLLIEDRKLSSFVMSYRQEEVLWLLGWDVTDETRLALDEAIERYAGIDYEWALGGEELAAKGLSSCDGQACLVSGYAFENFEEGGKVKRASSEVRFAEEFVRELMTRSLFGINWDGVTGISSRTSSSL